MTAPFETPIEELIRHFKQLDEEQKQRLLNFARRLAQTPPIKGESGASIINAVNLFDTQSLDEIEAAIRQDCEIIDVHGWE